VLKPQTRNSFAIAVESRSPRLRRPENLATDCDFGSIGGVRLKHMDSHPIEFTGNY
jgi:hypothetical protein